MKILLVGINAKYIHSNIGIYSLKAYAKKYAYAFCDIDIEIAEYTINQLRSDIVKELYLKKPDIICFSCYIWNIEMIEDILDDLSRILPDTDIWLGGPEVSYDTERTMKRIPSITGIMLGEGEETFTKLIDSMGNYSDVKGIVYRDKSTGRIIDNGYPEPLDFSTVPFPYGDLQDFEHRIVYYETSRGCPFGCAYCLSSVDKKLRFRTMEQVRDELSFFIEAGVPQVKFVDRTFNCDHRRSVEILRFIQEHDNGKINFHFEVAGDILTDQEMDIICSLRPGLVQLEIGVQSTNADTLCAINRKTDMEALWRNVSRLRAAGNVHLHLDLIAGLPYEDIVSFRRSFDEVYRAGSHELQLGFLKMLKGAPINSMAEDHGIQASHKPPYEILSTRYLSYEDVIELKATEEMLELYHNSGQFVSIEEYVLRYYSSPYDFYHELALFYEKHSYPVMQSSRMRRYEVLLEFIEANIEKAESELVRELLTKDYYLRENAKSRPSFAPDSSAYIPVIKDFYRDEANIARYLDSYKDHEPKQIMRMTHMEYFKHIDGGVWCLFDYENIHQVTHSARVICIENLK